MNTKEITVRNDEESVRQVLALADQFAEDAKLTGRSKLHVTLLAEEAISMITAITGDFEGKFHIEGDEKGCRLHLDSKTEMDADKRRELLKVSSSGKNAAVKGIMGKIRELFETGMEDYKEVAALQSDYGIGTIGYGEMGLDSSYAVTQASLVWSLSRYRDNVESNMDSQESAQEAWDELEKSIVANIASDVKVGIMKGKVSLVIELLYKK